MNNEKPQLIVVEIFKALGDRKGFEWWWHDIDTAIKQEIYQELEDRVVAVLDSKQLCKECTSCAGLHHFEFDGETNLMWCRHCSAQTRTS